MAMFSHFSFLKFPTFFVFSQLIKKCQGLSAESGSHLVVFFLTTNQRTVFLAITYQLNEQT
jgi:hypothetical protein